MLTTLIATVRSWMEYRRQRADLLGLLENDDSVLEDIGLTRADIEAALSRPFRLDDGPVIEARRLSRLTLALDRRI